MSLKSHAGSQWKDIETTVQRCTKEERTEAGWFSGAGKSHRETEAESSGDSLQIQEVGKERLTGILSVAGNETELMILTID